MKILIKNKWFIAVVLFCVVSTLKAQSSYQLILSNYDKLYEVKIAVDTTVPNVEKKSISAHKVHCDFNVLFLWKGNYIVRIVAKPKNKMKISEINKIEATNLFLANCFDESMQQDSCLAIFPDIETYHLEDYFQQNYAENSDLGLMRDGTVMLYKIYDLEVYRCNLKNNPLLYHTCSSDFNNTYADYFTSNENDWQIKNSIYRNIFHDSKRQKRWMNTFIFPESMPVGCKSHTMHYDKKYGNASCKITCRIQNHRMCFIHNENRYNRPGPNADSVLLVNDCIYMPHVFVLPLSQVKYKIKSINNLPVKKFLISYNDRFKPKKLTPEVSINDRTYYSTNSACTPPRIGGTNSLEEYIRKNLIYPPHALKENIEGQVLLLVKIGKDGRLNKAQVIKSLDPECDEEALRLVKNVPYWIPAQKGNVQVNYIMQLPIVFQLD